MKQTELTYEICLDKIGIELNHQKDVTVDAIKFYVSNAYLLITGSLRRDGLGQVMVVKIPDPKLISTMDSFL